MKADQREMPLEVRKQLPDDHKPTDMSLTGEFKIPASQLPSAAPQTGFNPQVAFE